MSGTLRERLFFLEHPVHVHAVIHTYNWKLLGKTTVCSGGRRADSLEQLVDREHVQRKWGVSFFHFPHSDFSSCSEDQTTIDKLKKLKRWKGCFFTFVPLTFAAFPAKIIVGLVSKNNWKLLLTMSFRLFIFGVITQKLHAYLSAYCNSGGLIEH